ncbi:MAG: Tol-Pal system beta propeller repeat protein TolB [Desulfobacterales bacterium]
MVKTSQHSFRAAMVFFLLLLPLPAAALGQYDYIDIDSPFSRKVPIAIPAFSALSPEGTDAALLQKATDTLSRSLDFTGFFNIIDRGAYLLDANKTVMTVDQINFRNWTTIGAELLVTGGLSQTGSLIDVELRLFDTLAGKRLLGKRYHGTVEDLRSIILRFCNEVILQLTGKRGIFDTRIAFVTNGSGNKEIMICDFDGGNPVPFTRHGSISLSPAWSSDGKWIAYTTYVNNKPDIFIQRTEGGEKAFIQEKGINITPAWLPGQFTLSATMSFTGNQEIYLLTGAGKIIKKITDNWASDLSPSWSPDATKMAFVSNRTGAPQIYIQDIKTGQVERLTFEGNYNTQPSWSPVGDRIVYTSMAGSRNDLFVIDLKRRQPLQLTRDAGNNESPSWSPDASLIAFSSTREGPARIYVMTAFGADQRRLLSLPGEQFSPNWSPNLGKY